MFIRETLGLSAGVTFKTVDLPQELLFLHCDALLLYFQLLGLLSEVPGGILVLSLSPLKFCRLKLEGIIHLEQLSQITI